MCAICVMMRRRQEREANAQTADDRSFLGKWNSKISRMFMKANGWPQVTYFRSSRYSYAYAYAERSISSADYPFITTKPQSFHLFTWEFSSNLTHTWHTVNVSFRMKTESRFFVVSCLWFYFCFVLMG